MTVATTQTLAQTFSRLNDIGISKAFAKKMLPSWWDDKIALTASGLQQAQLYFSRAFNLDLMSWKVADQRLKHLDVQRKFKLNKNTVELDVALSANYLNAIAKLVLQNQSPHQATVPSSALELREKILKTSACVSLDSLLTWCQSAGIPVMSIEQLPGKKMTAMVTRFDNRYAIILSKKGHAAHLLFHLAHELGHIAHQHLQADGFVADSKIESNNALDADEKEADAFAIRLLNGGDVRYRANSYLKSGKALYEAAHIKGSQDQIDVGHIVLNYAFAQKDFGKGNIALTYLSSGADGGALVNKAFFASLDRERFSSEQIELLETATTYSA